MLSIPDHPPLPYSSSSLPVLLPRFLSPLSLLLWIRQICPSMGEVKHIPDCESSRTSARECTVHVFVSIWNIVLPLPPSQHPRPLPRPCTTYSRNYMETHEQRGITFFFHWIPLPLVLLFPAIKHVQIMAVPVGDKSKLAAMTENGGKERERGRGIRWERNRKERERGLRMRWGSRWREKYNGKEVERKEIIAGRRRQKERVGRGIQE